MSEEYAEIFREEAAELLEELESSLLELEESPDDLKIVGRVFRAMHTIKGSGAMFGFDEIADFTHHVETVLDKVREGEIAASKELIDLVLKSRDHISSLLDASESDAEKNHELGGEIIRQLEGLVAPAAITVEPEIIEAQEPDEQPSSADEVKSFTGENLHFRISFRPQPEFFSTGGDVEAIIADLRGMGELIITGQSTGTTAQYENGEVDAFWDFLLHTPYDENSVRDIFIFVENTSKIKIVELGSDHEDNFPEHQKIGDILVERGELNKNDLAEVLSERKPLGEVLVEKKIVSADKISSALNEQKILSDKRQAKAKAKVTDSLRVSADKLDNLINLVGEMVVTQARLTQVAAVMDSPELLEPVEEVERLTAELRDCVLNIRMVPIGTIFSKFKRLVRDLSDELGKDVELVMEGADTELDKGVIEQIGDPLIHLIRNSIDHGIEHPAQRLAAGKTANGKITLSAAHSGANVIIQVKDNGRGLDKEKIRAKAIEKGIINSDAELNDNDIFSLIFGAGVSTASQVTEVSGRGVGMDVVKSTIEGSLKGSVAVSSKKGAGTTVSITLPLTLAIIDGLLVKAGDTHFVLPLTQVEECVELVKADMNRFHGRHVFSVRDKLVPYVILREFFDLPGKTPDLQQMVIVNVNDERVGLVLDTVVGGHQTVIKNLGWVYRNAEGVSGATILGNGEVALIVDVANLICFSMKEETAFNKAARH